MTPGAGLVKQMADLKKDILGPRNNLIKRLKIVNLIMVRVKTGCPSKPRGRVGV
jgi:hypothetical protein